MYSAKSLLNSSALRGIKASLTVTLLSLVTKLISLSPLFFFYTRKKGFLYRLYPSFRIPFSICIYRRLITLATIALGIKIIPDCYILYSITLISCRGVILGFSFLLSVNS